MSSGRRDDGPWEERRPGGPHIWRTLGYRRTTTEPGRMEIEWDADDDYTFPDGDGSIVHGGMVATVLDTAMGGACATLLEEGESFLTADPARRVHASGPAGGLACGGSRRPADAPCRLLLRRSLRRGRDAPRQRPVHAGRAQNVSVGRSSATVRPFRGAAVD